MKLDYSILSKLPTAVLCIVVVISSVQGKPVGGYPNSLQSLGYGAPNHGGDSGYGNEPANYDFEYEVYGGGNFFGHKESRRDQKTNGKYHVLLPDGRRQIVEYIADESGYHPTISYEVVGNAVDNPSGGYGGSTGVSGGYEDGMGASGGYAGSTGVSGGYGSPAPTSGKSSSSSAQQSRYSSRIKRQFFRDVPLEEQNYSEDDSFVQTFSPEKNLNQVFRNRRRIEPKKSYLIVYPDTFPSVVNK